MQSLLDATVAGLTAGNYRYYVAAGRDHTILMSRKFYSEKSGGAFFVQWFDSFISGDTLPASQGALPAAILLRTAGKSCICIIEKMKKDKAANCYALLQTLRHRLDEIRRLRVC